MAKAKKALNQFQQPGALGSRNTQKRYSKDGEPFTERVVTNRELLKAGFWQPQTVTLIDWPCMKFGGGVRCRHWECKP